MLREIRLLEGVQEWWNHNSEVIKRVGGEVFGKTRGKKPPENKETWWWQDKVKEVVKAKKKDGKKIREKYGQQEDMQEKAKTSDGVYKELGTPEGERKIHRVAKSRDKNTKDYSHMKQVEDEN